MVIYDVGVIAPHVKSGRLNGLAVTSATPSALLPNLPPVAATVPGYEATGYTGMFVPAKTPPAVIRRLNQEIVRVLNTQEAKEKLLNQGSEVVGSSPDELATVIRNELSRMGKVIKDTGIKVE